MYLSLLKLFWKPLVGALLLVALFAAYKSKINAAHDAGVQETQAAYKVMSDAVALENAKVMATKEAQAELLNKRLEDLDHDKNIIANDLRAQLSRHRVCTDDKVRSDPVRPTEATTSSNDPTQGQAPTTDVASALVEFGTNCQTVTDQLDALQQWLK